MHKLIEQYQTEWALSPTELIDLYLQVFQVAHAAGHTIEQDESVVRYLRSLDKAPAAAQAAAKETAAAAAISALKSPHADKCDVLTGLSAVKQLGADPKYQNLFKLLSIFASGTVESFLKFETEQKDFLASIGLTHDDSLRKLRTLTLCTLGAQSHERSQAPKTAPAVGGDVKAASGGPGVPFAELASKLSLSDPLAIESAVLDAVQSGRIDAKIDQDNEVVYIQRAAQRTFAADGWAQIGVNLSKWHRNVQTALNTLSQVQTKARASAPDDDGGLYD